jgi:phosphatidylglycerol:prolipoprotein diacylglycerol transferase
MGPPVPPGSPAGSFQRLAGGEPTPIHPIQIYSALCGLGIFIAMLAFERWHRPTHGMVALLVLLLYAASRFAVEFFRAPDSDIGTYLALNHNQYVSLLLAVGGSGALALRAGRWRKPGKLISPNF